MGRQTASIGWKTSHRNIHETFAVYDSRLFFNSRRLVWEILGNKDISIPGTSRVLKATKSSRGNPGFKLPWVQNGRPERTEHKHGLFRYRAAGWIYIMVLKKEVGISTSSFDIVLPSSRRLHNTDGGIAHKISWLSYNAKVNAKNWVDLIGILSRIFAFPDRGPAGWAMELTGNDIPVWSVINPRNSRNNLTLIHVDVRCLIRFQDHRQGNLKRQVHNQSEEASSNPPKWTLIFEGWLFPV